MALQECYECNKDISSEAEICPSCGIRLRVSSQKSYTIFIVLMLFLGGFGAHRFYLNQPEIGILYVLFVWTLLPLIVAIIELMVFIILGKDRFNRKHNHTEGYLDYEA